MSAHSRTPWTLRVEFTKTTDPRFCDIGEYLSRAEILSGETLLAASHIRPLERSEAQIVADIRLMHAAPELLAALTSRCAFHDLPLDGAYHIGSDAHGERRYTCQLTTAERAVIARVEGRS